MKSKKAKEYLSRTAMSPNSPLAQDESFVWGDTSVIEAVELAEQEAEERMQTKAHKIILDMMTGIFHGDMPRKIADEFIQKLTDDEND